ncbi:MAG: S9 family peptidase [Anaerolineae bacterium]|nr:MAG: S9 family peptidase [Anaerolineae bacterium]
MTEINKVRPYGSWASTLSAANVAEGISAPSQIIVSEGIVYWSESRPREAGRVAIMRRLQNGEVEQATPKDFNCRTRVHEYGGGAFLADGKTLYASNFEDQRLYRIEAGADPVAISPEPEIPAGLRYADGRLSPDRNRIYCVRERHEPESNIENELVALSPEGDQAPNVIASGRDFYAYPRLSPDGKRLAWLEWDQPNMPWDGTELWVAGIGPDGALEHAQKIVGGPDESIFQPDWSPDGTLHFVSDRSGWWNLYRWQGEKGQALAPIEAEFGSPMWILGLSQYAFLTDGRIASIYSQDGLDYLALIHDQMLTQLDLELTTFRPRSLHFEPISDRLVFVGASPDRPGRVYALSVDGGELDPLSSAPSDLPHAEDISHAIPVKFPTAGGHEAHAFYYAPNNRKYSAPEGALPPLVVVCHGGPTGSTFSEFSLAHQYWTSRGFAVVDVNYRGSAGYGRAYRQLLNGEWGVADVEDCIHAARYLIERGDVDGERLIIRGGSAGGYTTLSALVFQDVFSAGASYYGVADVEALARDTHKFEARYLDSMIGPYPEEIELYRQRSPIHYVNRISSPLILLQGGKDKVVPPSQAELMVEALEEKGLPYAYLRFEEEAHGFRDSANIKRALEAELYFYSRIFGFDLGEPVEPVTIHNLAS